MCLSRVLFEVLSTRDTYGMLVTMNTDIQNLAFHLPNVRILGTNHCGEMQHTAFKRRELFQDVLCRRDYAEILVARFAN